MSVRAEDQFHVGIVVDDLDSALAQLSDLFGYEWCDPIAAPTPVTLPTGEAAVLDMRFTYSMSVPRLEVIRSIHGTLWSPVEGSGIHHVGYWSDDVPGDSALLADRGAPCEVAGTRPDGTIYWAYHRAPTGPRIELVTTALRPTLKSYWSTGRLPPP